MFSFGKNKSSNRSKSSSSTFVDPNQQPYLSDIYSRGRDLSNQEFPVEGVAGINPYLRNGLENQYNGGDMISGGGAALMRQGSGLVGGSDSALRFSNAAMMGGPDQSNGAGFAFGAGNTYSNGVLDAGVAQGDGANFGMANNMGNSASTGGAASMNAANNAGFDINNVGNYINNDVLQGQIDAASRDITRNLQQNTLPSIQSQAAGAGSSGSSRIGNLMGTAMGMANESIGDISANMRGNAFNQGLGIEANRAGQNAGFQQGANQANANFMQNSNQFNAGQQNQLRSQGFGIGASQLEANLGRQQQGNQFNARSFNDSRDFGSQIGANAFNSNMQNQQFGASLAATLGNQGVNNMNAGAEMFGFGNRMQMGAGQYQRDYDQQLQNYNYQRAMSPYSSMDFYANLVGGPNNLSRSSSSSRGKSSGFKIGYTPKPA
jgi:hypothetical protein